MEAVREQVETEGVNWEQELTRFEESGLSGAAYCRERNLRYSTFGYHKRKKDTVAKPKFRNPDLGRSLRSHEKAGRSCVTVGSRI